MQVSFADAMLIADDLEGRECSDGRLGIRDIAKAARVPFRAAKRAVLQHVAGDDNSEETPTGSILAFDKRGVPDPANVTRAELAAIVAERLGLGIYKTRLFAPPPPPKPVERKPVGTEQHPYKTEQGGRSYKSFEHGRIKARLTCRCGNSHDIGFRQLAGAQQMDQKFQQAGWRLDPAKCPTCIHKRKETKVAASTMTPAAMRAQVTMVQQLTDNFDVDAGTYAPGISDDTIAKLTGLSVDAVKQFREAAFGPLREPAEIIQLARDIATLSSMIDEAVVPLKAEMLALSARLADIRKRFPA